MELGIKGKSAVVTGGSKGIGYASAQQMLEAGARVTICARNEEQLNKARGELAKISPDVQAVARVDNRELPAPGRLATRASELFRKRSLLYGLDRARAAIAKQDRAVVVEGNTDVLALRQAGFEPVVASMGTALTEPQLTDL